MSEKRKEKEYKNYLIKIKNDELIEERRQKLINKYNKREEKIKKQKKKNEIKISEKYLEIAIKREDTSKNLTRYERQIEFQRQKKLDFMDKRNERLINIQKQKEEINYKKRQLSQNVSKRKSELLKKAKIILTSGNFKSKDDIYQKVFNDEELGFLTKTPNQTRKKKVNILKDENETFFLTQNVKKDSENDNQNLGKDDKIKN